MTSPPTPLLKGEGSGYAVKFIANFFLHSHPSPLRRGAGVRSIYGNL